MSIQTPQFKLFVSTCGAKGGAKGAWYTVITGGIGASLLQDPQQRLGVDKDTPGIFVGEPEFFRTDPWAAETLK